MNNINKEALKNFITLRIKRNERGIEVFCKSALIEQFFSDNYTIEAKCLSNGIYCYPPRIRKLFKNDYLIAIFDHLAEDYSLFENDIVNLSLLRMKDLKKGISINLKDAYKLEKINHFLEEAKKALQFFFQQYIEHFDVSLKIPENGNYGKV